MPTVLHQAGIALLASLAFAANTRASDWPQFRGPNGSGRAGGAGRLPDRI